MYFVYADCYNVGFKRVHYDSNINLESSSLLEEIDENTRLVILANPNSPFGDYKDKGEIYKICEYTMKMGVTLLIDEAYVEFSPGTCIDLCKEFNNVVFSRTFSKALGGAGIRVGYLAGNSELINNVWNVQQAYPISGPSLKFANYILDNFSHVEKYISETVVEREFVVKSLSGKYDVINSHTNFIHIHQKTGDNSETVNTLKRNGVGFKSGVTVPGDNRKNWIRISIGPGMSSLSFFKELV